MSYVTSTPGRILTLAVPCDLAAVRVASRQMRGFIEEQGVDSADLDAWELICAEAGNNAVEHTPPDRTSLPIEFVIQVTPLDVELRLVDHTPGFDMPDDVELPDPMSESGRGIFLMKTLSDQLRYLRGRGENCLVIRRRRTSPANGSEIGKSPIDVVVLESTLQSMTEELAGVYESLSAIFRFTAELNRGGAGAEFTERWLGEMALAVGADWFLLRLADHGGSILRCERSSRAELAFEPLTFLSVDGAASGVELQAATGRQDIWFDAANPLTPQDPLSRFGTPASGFAHPIFVNDELVGVVSVGRYATHQSFIAGQVNIIHTFADFLGIQVRNARIQEEYLRSRLVSRELEIAANIQRSLLPERLPEPPGFRMAGYSKSASKVGGDFYDVLPVDTPEARGQLMVIADVMGKGVPAAMFAAIFRSHLHARINLAHRPGEFLSWLNQALFSDLDRVDMFVTAQLVFLDADRREVRIAAAGHCPLLVASPGSTVDEVVADGPPLGIDGRLTFTEHCFPLRPGFRLAMITDGLVEARSAAGDLMGVQPVKDWLLGTVRSGLSARAASQSLVELARRFQGDAPASDDLTFLLLADHPESAR